MVRILKSGFLYLNHPSLGLGNIYFDLTTGLVYKAKKTLDGLFEL